MLQKFTLLRNGIQYFRVAMSARNSNYPRKSINITPPTVIIKILHLPLHDIQGFLIIMEQGGSEERFALCENFIGGGTVVGSRFVIERRQLLRRRNDSIGGGGSSGALERRKGRAVACDCNGCLE
ncbi:hypothetical protein V8G54_003883 [Vigna mungo]|uniref:Uncharacterized protein n=1 Tax=Vigna mungo TaxID=3915 RepID=A0AAQ3SEQ9_VIGMU